MVHVKDEIVIREGGVYAFDSVRRYGGLQDRNPHIASVLDRDIHHAAQLTEAFTQFLPQLKDLPLAKVDDVEPYFGNDYLGHFNAVSLYSMIAHFKPPTYLEIGSGHSTRFVHRARRDHKLDTRIMSIDPYPRSEIDEICDEVLRFGLPEVDLNIFQQLQPGDFVFFDGTHRVFMNSDVTVFFLEVLPSLPAGVIIAIDDIFVPYDYPHGWEPRFYSEQYMLGLLVLEGRDRYRFLLPTAYSWDHPACEEAMNRLYQDLSPSIWRYGGLFWMEKLV